MAVQMIEYLTRAGWKRDGDHWHDPQPELRGVTSNSQLLHEAVKMQMERDTVHLAEYVVQR